MGRFNLEQRWEILKCYFQSNCCVAETVRRLKIEFGPDNAPTAPAVRQFVKKVRLTGMLIDNKPVTRSCPIRSIDTVELVAKSVKENPHLSIRQRSQKLNISYSSLRRILVDNLGLTICKTTKEETMPEGELEDEILEPKKAEAKISTDDCESSLNGLETI